MIYGLLTTVLLVLVLNDSGTQGTPTRVCTTTSPSSSNGICGGTLRETIRFVCANNYPRNRRDVMSEPVNTIDDIVLTKPDALSYLTKRQGTGTVVCECCRNRCNVFEMLDYCHVFGYGKKI